MTDPSTEQFPAFSQIDPDQTEAQLKALLNQHRAELASLLAGSPGLTWDRLMAPLAEYDNVLHRFWAPIAHLHAVRESDSLRAAYNACILLLSDYHSFRMQHEKLFEAIQSIHTGSGFEQLSPARRKIIENALRDFRLSGVNLTADAKKQFADLQKNLTLLSARFSENVLDATQGFSIDISQCEALQGLPDMSRQRAAAEAKKAEKTGWRLTLDQPAFTAAMKYLENRPLRERLYTAHVTRASDQGPHAGRWDNSALMAEMVENRMALARLAGFRSYAEYALATRMAKTPAEVTHFLYDLAERARPFALGEMETLQAFAENAGHAGELQPWDMAFYSEKLQQACFSITDEQIRPWFQAEKVMEGMFAIMGKLFGIHLAERRGRDVWHPEVRFFEVHDAGGELRGYLYTDLYARTGKREGAWMDDCQSRQRLIKGDLQFPVAFLTCNFMPPAGAQPALLTHDDVQTVFHEFGHCLHHLLTRVEEAGVSGINGVPWDAVEFPSQFFEHWCWDRQTLTDISAHVKTGEPFPDELFDRLVAARHFQSGLHMLRQLEFALFDFRLHHEFSGGGAAEIQRILNEVRSVTCVRPVAPFNRFQNAFLHIFAGGYAAGYYSYKWAEVLSSDAFSLFEERGIFDRSTGQSFLENILEQGGVQDPMILFEKFRGRKPRVDALLRHLGLAMETR